jgi:hypothetical protein
MTETPAVRSLLDAAEEAMAAGDFATAERHLADVVSRQEAELGPHHPDLANTLNNLGVVSERAENFAGAERAYRRAYKIAREHLEPAHPFVATSEANLREFCEARGLPMESPASPAPVAAPPPMVISVPAREPARPEASGRTWSPTALTAIGGLAAAALVLVWQFTGRSSQTTGAAIPSEPVATAPAREPPPAQPPPVAAAVPTPAPEAPRVTKPAAVASKPETTRASSPESVSIVRADVCRTFSTATQQNGDWRCEPVEDTVAPGAFVFYTRLKSPGATTVVHRWYQGENLVQGVELRVGANPGAGYRTYSRNTIGPERAGAWRVELRSRDGALLHEVRFVVR